MLRQIDQPGDGGHPAQCGGQILVEPSPSEENQGGKTSFGLCKDCVHISHTDLLQLANRIDLLDVTFCNASQSLYLALTSHTPYFLLGDTLITYPTRPQHDLLSKYSLMNCSETDRICIARRAQKLQQPRL